MECVSAVYAMTYPYYLYVTFIQFGRMILPLLRYIKREEIEEFNPN